MINLKHILKSITDSIEEKDGEKLPLPAPTVDIGAPAVGAAIPLGGAIAGAVKAGTNRNYMEQRSDAVKMANYQNAWTAAAQEIIDVAVKAATA